MPLPWRTQKSMTISDTSSKLVTLPLASERATPSSASASCGDLTPMKAVSTARGFGNSFSTAAVMMPSVPSAPMNRLCRL